MLFETLLVEISSPAYPCIQINGSIIFGPSAILRYVLYGSLKLPFNALFEEIIDLDEFSVRISAGRCH